MRLRQNHAVWAPRQFVMLRKSFLVFLKFWRIHKAGQGHSPFLLFEPYSIRILGPQSGRNNNPPRHSQQKMARRGTPPPVFWQRVRICLIRTMAMKALPASSPMWCMVQMLGWFNAETACASRRKRDRLCGSWLRHQQELRVTKRCRRVSSAL